MGKPAARITDMHVCPMVTGMVPHVGGPVTGPGVPTVLIGSMPAAVMGDMCVCTGPPDTIILGSMGVFIGGKPAARMGDMCAHGGTIVSGCPTVLIGEALPGSPPSPVLPLPVKAAMQQMTPATAAVADQILTMKAAAKNGTPFCEKCAKAAAARAKEEEKAKEKKAAAKDSGKLSEKELKKAIAAQNKMLKAKKKELEKWDKKAQKRFNKWFGSTDDESKKVILDRIDKMIALNEKMTPEKMVKADPEKATRFAYVHPNDPEHKIYYDRQFIAASNTGTDSRAGVLSHEMSHFDDIGGTQDHVYGVKKSKALAEADPERALENADSFEYYLENADESILNIF